MGAKSMLHRPIIIASIAFALAAPALAQSDPAVEAARARGEVGEQADGYSACAAAAATSARTSTRSTSSVARSTPISRRSAV
jgi:uncharacterized protein YdbL (DUF1318 family)